MRSDPNDGNVLFNRDEEFRQTVIRQAIMLGFEAEEYTVERPHSTVHRIMGGTQARWRFKAHDGEFYGAYSSVYSAAFDYLRLLKVPNEVIGVVRHED
jgi:hypothetical protein